MPMVTNTTRMSAARPTTIIAGRMEIPPGVAGRSGSGAAVPNVMAGPAYGRPDHPKWSSGP